MDKRVSMMLLALLAMTCVSAEHMSMESSEGLLATPLKPTVPKFNLEPNTPRRSLQTARPFVVSAAMPLKPTAPKFHLEPSTPRRSLQTARPFIVSATQPKQPNTPKFNSRTNN